MVDFVLKSWYTTMFVVHTRRVSHEHTDMDVGRFREVGCWPDKGLSLDRVLAHPPSPDVHTSADLGDDRQSALRPRDRQAGRPSGRLARQASHQARNPYGNRALIIKASES